MKYRESELIGSTLSALRRYLLDVPFPCVLEDADSAALDVDWAGKIRLANGERPLLLEARPSGQPRLAREAANQLHRWAEKYPDAVRIFGAPYISPQAADLLTRDGVGYVDLAGNCRLAFDQVYIHRVGWPNPVVRRRELRSLYSPKAECILRVMLAEPQRKWKIESLAQAADVSLGQASNVKKLLEDREWLRREPEGLALVDPKSVLAEWAQEYRFDRNTVHDFFSLDPLSQIEGKLADVCRQSGTRYALTGFSAAARLAPMVRYQRATAYVIGDIAEVAQRAGFKPVTSGANVSLIEPYDAGVLAGGREIDGIHLASPVQVYLDLLSFRGRGEEAAQAVLDEVIRPTW